MMRLPFARFSAVVLSAAVASAAIGLAAGAPALAQAEKVVTVVLNVDVFHDPRRCPAS